VRADHGRVGDILQFGVTALLEAKGMNLESGTNSKQCFSAMSEKSPEGHPFTVLCRRKAAWFSKRDDRVVFANFQYRHKEREAHF
jgi:adenylyl- and sulfurtransferase ThiI